MMRRSPSNSGNTQPRSQPKVARQRQYQRHRSATICPRHIEERLLVLLLASGGLRPTSYAERLWLCARCLLFALRPPALFSTVSSFSSVVIFVATHTSRTHTSHSHYHSYVSLTGGAATSACKSLAEGQWDGFNRLCASDLLRNGRFQDSLLVSESGTRLFRADFTFQQHQPPFVAPVSSFQH